MVIRLLFLLLAMWSEAPAAVSLSGVTLAQPFVAQKRIAISNRNRAYCYGPSTVTWQSGTYRSAHAGVAACGFSAIQALWGNYNYLVTDQPGANTITINATLEYAGFNAFAFSSASPVAIGTTGTALSDTMALRIPAGTEFFMRVYQNPLTAGQTWPIGQIQFNSFEGSNRAAGTVADLTGGGAVPFNSTNPTDATYDCMVVTGIPDAPCSSWLGLGDSITYGQGDTVPILVPGCYGASEMGWFDRACANRFGSVNLGTRGDKLSDFIGTGGQYRLGGNIASYCTHCSLAYGRNDLAAGVSAATFTAELVTEVAALNALGLKVYVCTILPKTSSTDNWATLVNQNAGVDSVRVAINTNIRNGITGAAGFFDLCTPVESSLDSGLWIVNGTAFYATGDGIHPSSTSAALMATYAAPLMSTTP